MSAKQQNIDWFKACAEHVHCTPPRTDHGHDAKFVRCSECGQWWAFNGLAA